MEENKPYGGYPDKEIADHIQKLINSNKPKTTMLHKTVGNHLLIEIDEEGWLMCYDDNPDHGHGHIRRKNPEMHTIEEEEVDNYLVYIAYIDYYSPCKAYHKLKEIGIVN